MLYYALAVAFFASVSLALPYCPCPKTQPCYDDVLGLCAFAIEGNCTDFQVACSKKTGDLKYNSTYTLLIEFDVAGETIGVLKHGSNLFLNAFNEALRNTEIPLGTMYDQYLQNSTLGALMAVVAFDDTTARTYVKTYVNSNQLAFDVNNTVYVRATIAYDYDAVQSNNSSGIVGLIVGLVIGFIVALVAVVMVVAKRRRRSEEVRIAVLNTRPYPMFRHESM
jgi:F0F1-type ATP synthase assembly protein I